MRGGGIAPPQNFRFPARADYYNDPNSRISCGILSGGRQKHSEWAGRGCTPKRNGSAPPGARRHATFRGAKTNPITVSPNSIHRKDTSRVGTYPLETARSCFGHGWQCCRRTNDFLQPRLLFDSETIKPVGVSPRLFLFNAWCAREFGDAEIKSRLGAFVRFGLEPECDPRSDAYSAITPAHRFRCAMDE